MSMTCRTLAPYPFLSTAVFGGSAIALGGSDAQKQTILPGVAAGETLLAFAFQEKPPRGTEIPGRPGFCLGSMGIYIFEAQELIRRLRADAEMGAESKHDFGGDIIPKMIGETRVFAHHFKGIHGSDRP